MATLLTKAILAKWAKMTDENEHFEVRADIAKRFKMYDFQRAFDELIEARDRKHGVYCLQAECLLTDMMFERIESEYGATMVAKIKNCL